MLDVHKSFMPISVGTMAIMMEIGNIAHVWTVTNNIKGITTSSKKLLVTRALLLGQLVKHVAADCLLSLGCIRRFAATAMASRQGVQHQTLHLRQLSTGRNGIGIVTYWLSHNLTHTARLRGA